MPRTATTLRLRSGETDAPREIVRTGSTRINLSFLRLRYTALADLVVKAMKLPGAPVDVGEDAVPMPLSRGAAVAAE